MSYVKVSVWLRGEPRGYFSVVLALFYVLVNNLGIEEYEPGFVMDLHLLDEVDFVFDWILYRDDALCRIVERLQGRV